MTNSKADKPATIYDVARLAGVSHQSVSRVLRNVPEVREDTREKVEAALRQLDYRPNTLARELASQRRRRIGVVGYESFESSTAKMLKGVNEVLVEGGFVLEIVTVNPLGDVSDIVQQIESINAMDVVGLLATSPTEQVRQALERSVLKMPVYLDESQGREGEFGDAISSAMVMEHLFELGHTRIAHVAGPANWDSARHRCDQYVSEMRDRGLDPLPVVNGDWSAASGYRAGNELPWSAHPTAVFVANDRMALGVLRALAERGLRVPEDISVAGIDDIPEAAFFSPPLTTVHVDFEGAGRAAARGLIALVDGPSAEPAEYPARRFIARQSTSAPPR